MFNPLIILIGLLFGVALFILGYFARKISTEKTVENAEQNAKRILEDAKKEADNKRREVEIEGKDLKFKIRAEFEETTKDKRQELVGLEKRLIQKEENIERKAEVIDGKEKQINQRETNLSNKEKDVENDKRELSKLIAEERQSLQRISGMTAQDAKKLLMSKMEEEARQSTSQPSYSFWTGLPSSSVRMPIKKPATYCLLRYKNARQNIRLRQP